MSQVIDLLLALDSNKLELPSKEFEIKRLTELTGQPVIFKLQGISQTRLNDLREMAAKMNPDTKEMEVDVRELRISTVVEGVKEPNLRDKPLMDHYGVKTPYDLVKKLLRAGEADKLYEHITRLSGYDEKAIEEVKKQ